MDWTMILTAGTVSALVSASVGLVTTILTLRVARKKEQHTHLFGELLELRSALYEIGPAECSDEVLVSGAISGPQFTELLKNFLAGDELYLKKYRPYFDRDLQKKIDKVRDPVISWVSETGRFLKQAEIEGAEVDHPEFTPILSEVITYLNVLTEATDEQIRRVRV